MTLREAWMHIKNSLQWCEPIPVLDKSIEIVEKALEKELENEDKDNKRSV